MKKQELVSSRPVSCDLDDILGVTFPVLDDGFVRVIDYMEMSALTGQGLHAVIDACLDYLLPTFRPLAAERSQRPEIRATAQL